MRSAWKNDLVDLIAWNMVENVEEVDAKIYEELLEDDRNANEWDQEIVNDSEIWI